jgi:rhomboid protease GluP
MSEYQSPLPVDRIENGKTPPPPQQAVLQLPIRKPAVTYGIIVLTVIMYLLQLASKSLYGGADFPAALGAKVNQFIEAGEVWRFITPVLFHGSLLHIALNMYALFALGPNLERFYGHFRFLLLYIAGAFTGNVFSYLMSEKSSLGASTAIFGLILAQAVFVYQNRQYFGSRAKSMLLNMGMIVIFNLVLGLSPGIDNWGHLGGLLGGLVFAWFAGPVLEVSGVFPTLALKDRRSNTPALVTLAVIILAAGSAAVIKILN